MNKVDSVLLHLNDLHVTSNLQYVAQTVEDAIEVIRELTILSSLREKEKCRLVVKLNTTEAELRYARTALRELWTGTVWGAGKGAALSFNRQALIKAGVEDAKLEKWKGKTND